MIEPFAVKMIIHRNKNIRLTETGNCDPLKKPVLSLHPIDSAKGSYGYRPAISTCCLLTSKRRSRWIIDQRI